VTDDDARVVLGYVGAGSGRSWTATPEQCARLRAALFEHDVEPGFSLSPFILRHPGLLGPLDAATRLRYPHAPLRRLLLVTSAVVECTPESADWLLPRDRSFFELLRRSSRPLARSSIKLVFGLAFLVRPALLRRYAGL
jgi:hypothetical protein